MQIWTYDRRTGELLGASQADPNPLKPGQWLVPAFSTTAAPPAPPQGSVAVFQNGAWSTIEDHRGTTIYAPDGTEIVVADLGPTPAGYSTVKPPPPPPTPQELCDQVDAFKQQRLAEGYADAVTGKTWPCDDPSIARWGAFVSSAGLAIVMSTQPPPTFDLIPADNQTIQLSAADTFDLLNGRVMPWVSAVTVFARTMKNNILAGNPPADLTAGWP